MKCYVCKAKVSTATRHFMKTQNRREKDQFRDLCDNCYPAQMTKEGYSFKGNSWQKEEAENESLKIDYDVRGEELYEVRKQRDRLQAEKAELLKACNLLFGYIEDGTLVRDITKDGDSDWSLRMMRFVSDLGKIQAAIKAAEGSEI